jgi:hypothetical protein
MTLRYRATGTNPLVATRVEIWGPSGALVEAELLPDLSLEWKREGVYMPARLEWSARGLPAPRLAGSEVRLYVDDALHFVGLLLPQATSIPLDIGTEDVHQEAAVCGLALLSELPYAPVSGRQPVSDLITDLLQGAVNLPVDYTSDWSPALSVATIDPEVWRDAEDLTSAQALRDLLALFDLVVHQEGGRWKVRGLAARTTTASPVTVSRRAGGVDERIAPISRASVEHDAPRYGTPRLLTAPWSDGFVSGSEHLYWEPTLGTTGRTDPSIGIAYVTVGSHLWLQLPVYTTTSGAWVQATTPIPDRAPGVNLSLQATVQVRGDSTSPLAEYSWKAEIEVKAGSRYWDGSTWTTTPSRLEIERFAVGADTQHEISFAFPQPPDRAPLVVRAYAAVDLAGPDLSTQTYWKELLISEVVPVTVPLVRARAEALRAPGGSLERTERAQDTNAIGVWSPGFPLQNDLLPLLVAAGDGTDLVHYVTSFTSATVSGTPYQITTQTLVNRYQSGRLIRRAAYLGLPLPSSPLQDGSTLLCPPRELEWTFFPPLASGLWEHA